MSYESVPNPGKGLPPKDVSMDLVEDGVKKILQGLGQSDKEEVMRNTPRRVAELYQDLINAPWCDIEVPWKCFPNPGVSDMIMITDCHYISMCEHHLAPALGVAHFAYIPKERITGYSKIKKALNYVARQPQLNERILVDSLNILEEVLEPRGVGLVFHSVHMCLIFKANAPSQEIVTIQDFRGEMKNDPYRRDLLSTAYGKRPVFGA